MSETQAAPELTGRMFLFERPELMNKEEHGALGYTQPKRRFGFCSKVRAIPVTISEVTAAMKEYPIIFQSNENPIPLAVVGLVDDENLFVDENGDWEENRYIPGYIRRYPFGVANETGGERFAIVIDRAFEGFKENAQTPLFENGEMSQFAQQAVDFCSAFEQERQLTEQFSKKLAEFDLIRGQSAQYTPQGETAPRTFAEYFGIDENRLKELSDEKVLEVHKTGLLPVVYASLMSMGNWRMIMQRRAKRHGLTDQNVMNPVAS